jgi:predicted O-linked N-acetylglucosamine transferase (SPINDLY family)
MKSSKYTTRSQENIASGREPVGRMLERARAYELAGNIVGAESVYRQVLAVTPENDVAQHCLGLIAHRKGKLNLAVKLIGKAAVVNPAQPRYRTDLGLLLIKQGKLTEAVPHFEAAAALDPGNVAAHCDLALALRSQNRFEEAAACCRRALALDPENREAHNTLGLALQALGRIEEAVGSFRRAIRSDPSCAEAHNNLGVVLSGRGEPQQASECFRRAIELKPDFVGARNNLGNSLRAEGKPDQAIACFLEALALSSENPLTLNNLGIAYRAKGMIEQARASFKRALAVQPDSPLTHHNLGLTYMASGEPQVALECFRAALRLNPDYAAARSSLLFCMNYVASAGLESIYSQHVSFGKRFEEPLKRAWRPHTKLAEPTRRLRVGYVSGDFREHAMAPSIEAVLARHNRNEFEIYCYPTNHLQDEVTGRMRACVDHWYELADLDDDRAAERIRADRIDILVDLSGHTADNRLLVFARKPAPVQVSWLGYMMTTGLSAIDYRISDGCADPPGTTETLHTETLWRLPSVTVFQPPENSPPVDSLPLSTVGQFTFGCLNNPAKLGSDVVETWARILTALPDSRLLLGNAGDPAIRNRLVRAFAEHGVSESRLGFQPKLPLAEYLRLHHRIDLGLDPFPYNGGATSCYSLWMGVPFVALSGDRYMARMGVSLLTNVGLGSLVAEKPDEYVALACKLASDPINLAAIRASLRERMANSIADGARFTRNLESAYREMWRRWCRKVSTSSGMGFGDQPIS